MPGPARAHRKANIAANQPIAIVTVDESMLDEEDRVATVTQAKSVALGEGKTMSMRNGVMITNIPVPKNHVAPGYDALMQSIPYIPRWLHYCKHDSAQPYKGHRAIKESLKYNLQVEDMKLVESLNAMEGGAARGRTAARSLITLDQLQTLMTMLEKQVNFLEIVDPRFYFTLQQAVKYVQDINTNQQNMQQMTQTNSRYQSQPGPSGNTLTHFSQQHITVVYNHWIKSRRRIRKPLIRHFWPKPLVDNCSPHVTFRPRDMGRRTSRRTSTKWNTSVMLKKILTLKRDMTKLDTLMDIIMAREVTKQQILANDALLFDAKLKQSSFGMAFGGALKQLMAQNRNMKEAIVTTSVNLPGQTLRKVNSIFLDKHQRVLDLYAATHFEDKHFKHVQVGTYPVSRPNIALLLQSSLPDIPYAKPGIMVELKRRAVEAARQRRERRKLRAERKRKRATARAAAEKLAEAQRRQHLAKLQERQEHLRQQKRNKKAAKLAAKKNTDQRDARRHEAEEQAQRAQKAKKAIKRKVLLVLPESEDSQSDLDSSDGYQNDLLDFLRDRSQRLELDQGNHSMVHTPSQSPLSGPPPASRSNAFDTYPLQQEQFYPHDLFRDEARPRPMKKHKPNPPQYLMGLDYLEKMRPQRPSLFQPVVRPRVARNNRVVYDLFEDTTHCSDADIDQ